MRFVTVVLAMALGSACSPEPGEAVASRRQSVTTLSPTTLGTTDGGKLGTAVIACPPDLFAATEPGSSRVWFSPGTLVVAPATSRRRSLACRLDQVFSVGDAGVERVTSTGVSFPFTTPGDVVSTHGTQLVVGAPSSVTLIDFTTGTEDTTFIPSPSAPTGVAATATHLYVARGSANQLVVQGRSANAVILNDPTTSFGAAIVIGDFSPAVGLEIAVAHLGGVKVIQNDGALLWQLVQRGGTPQVPSIALAPKWLDKGLLGALDGLLVGYSNLDSVGLYLGSELVEEFVPTTSDGQFGASVYSAGNLLFVGAPQHVGRGALYATSLPAPPWSSSVIQDCSTALCVLPSSCFGQVACVVRGNTPDAGMMLDDAGVSFGDGGMATVDGGVVTSDGGTANSDGGVVTTDGGAVTLDGGVVTVDGGGVTTDGGAIIRDGGVVQLDGGRPTDAGIADAGTSKADGGVTQTDGGTGKDAGLEVHFVASGCACSEANGLLVALSAMWLARRRRR